RRRPMRSPHPPRYARHPPLRGGIERVDRPAEVTQGAIMFGTRTGGNVMRSFKFVAGVLAFGVLAAGAAQAADPVKIRRPSVAPVTNWASIWLEKKDLAKHFGKSYVFEAGRFQGTPPMITASGHKALEIAQARS